MNQSFNSAIGTRAIVRHFPPGRKSSKGLVAAPLRDLAQRRARGGEDGVCAQHVVLKRARLPERARGVEPRGGGEHVGEFRRGRDH